MDFRLVFFPPCTYKHHSNTVNTSTYEYYYNVSQGIKHSNNIKSLLSKSQTPQFPVCPSNSLLQTNNPQLCVTLRWESLKKSTWVDAQQDLLWLDNGDVCREVEDYKCSNGGKTPAYVWSRYNGPSLHRQTGSSLLSHRLISKMNRIILQLFAVGFCFAVGKIKSLLWFIQWKRVYYFYFLATRLPF